MSHPTPANSPSPRSSPAPTPLTTVDADKFRLSRLRGIIDTELSSYRFDREQPSLFRNPTPHMIQALEWMAFEDPLKYHLITTSSKILAERYVIVLLYLATSGTKWLAQSKFLTNVSVCDWNEDALNHTAAPSEPIGVGIYCGAFETVENILLRELRKR